MAALQHLAASSTSAIGSHRILPRKINTSRPVSLISSFSTSFGVKRNRRRNYLRQKILKTLKKPIFPKLPPTLPTESPPQDIEETGSIPEIQQSEKSKIFDGGNEEARKSEELSEIEGSVPAGIGVFPKNSILKYGFWLFGAFVFQTVCAVCFFVSADDDNKREVMNGIGESSVEVVLNGYGNGKVGLKNSLIDSTGYVDELDMERKIEEIRVMAREAREKERLESKRNDLDIEDGEENNGGKYFKSGIEEEVDNRLFNLRKKLGNARLKPIGSVEKGELDDKGSNGALLFKKKNRFKGLYDNPMERPKGFGSDKTRINSGNGDKNGQDGEKLEDLSDDDRKGIDAGLLGEEDSKKASEMNESTKNTRKKVVKERGTSKEGMGKVVTKPKVVDGIALEKNDRRSALEPVRSRKLNGEAVKSRKSSALDDAVVSKKFSKENGTSRGKGFGEAKSAIKSESETDFWWLNLPYVLVIAMQRGDNGEGGEGPYTLRSISGTGDEISHMVAFEDLADATNFCYLLQLFFEDLEEFRADVVPLTIPELNEALKLLDERVLVVKRGQLKLYAGLSLTDAEMALRAMIEQG